MNKTTAKNLEFVKQHLDLYSPALLKTMANGLRKKFDAGVAAAKNPGVFNKLSQRQKAVALAIDVIANVRLDKFMVEHRGYIAHHGDESSPEAKLSVGTKAGAACLIGSNCTVCAKGALFMTSVLKTNKVKVYDVLNSDNEDMRTRVLRKEKIFDKKTYDLIEVAFEGSDVGDAGDHLDESYTNDTGDINWDARDEDIRSCKYNYHDKFYEPRMRLVAIMLNVVDNDGVFVPTYHIDNARVMKELK
jgi:hypothetical protein